MSEEKENGIDKDVELLKLQIYTEQCHTKLTVLLSFIFGLLFAFSVVFYTLLYEGVFSLLQFGIVFGVLYGFCCFYLISIISGYNRNIQRISDMLEMVKEGKELPKLEELGKIGERDRVTVESEKEPESQIPNAELFATRIGALLDFYSDRAVAHASFFVASIFGIVTLLAIIQQLGDILFVWFSIPLFYVFSYMGYYTLGRFGYYADISQRLSEHGLKLKETLCTIPFEQATLNSYIDKQEELQKKLFILRKIIAKGRGKYYLALLYWVIVSFLGSIVYSKFWHSGIEWIEWFGFLGIMVIVFVLSPWLYYRKSKENKE